MESGNGDLLGVGEAYNRLQIHQNAVPDETVLFYYTQVMKGAPPGSVESYKEALRVIALDRQSNYLLRKLEDPDADVRATTAEPVGLDNIGNTCYLNSLLQFYYTVKPVRDMVIDFQNYRMIINEENLRKKRAGGRIIEKAEIIKAQKCMFLLPVKIFNR
jgi:ubiquitin carboxyl-terminal hydrolase 25/28